MVASVAQARSQLAQTQTTAATTKRALEGAARPAAPAPARSTKHRFGHCHRTAAARGARDQVQGAHMQASI
eukprot:1885406-Pleurochrysis_carterae.AAC.1